MNSTAPMAIGQLVLLVGRESEMPPIGIVGEIISPPDCDGDYDVMFSDYPCPAGPDPSWIVPTAWLVPINPPAAPILERLMAEIGGVK